MRAILGENAPNWLCPTAPSYKAPVCAEPDMVLHKCPEARKHRAKAPEGYIGMKAAATQHAMSYRTIKSAVQRGSIKSIKIGVSVFIPLDGVDRYLAASRNSDRARMMRAKKRRVDEYKNDGIIKSEAICAK